MKEISQEEMRAAPWWGPVGLLVMAGYNVEVGDPGAVENREGWDRDTSHGVVTVIPRVGIGWEITVRQLPLDDERTDYPMDTDETPVEPPPGAT